MTLDVQKILDVDDPDAVVRRASDLLNEGQLVILPTETVYGAAVRLDRPKAVEAFRRIRGDATGPFTVHVASPTQVRELVGPLSELGLRMTQKLWPGPVSLVFDVPADLRAATTKRLGLSESDLYADGTMTLRCPDHLIARDVIEGVDGIVAITRVSPPTETTDPVVEENVSLVIDAGRTRFSKPSTIVRIQGEKYKVVRDGVYDARIIEKQLKTLVLFVCSGNTCRSPMASALATKLIKEKYGLGEADTEAAGISVQSAGTFAMPGLRATPQAVEAMDALGVDLNNHRSRQLTPELIHAADFIFTMGKAHTQAVLAMAPAAASRVIPINPEGDVEDPIGGALSLYQEVAASFQRLIQDRFEQTLFKLHPPEERS
jgi:protein-tyrosine phosphatase